MIKYEVALKHILRNSRLLPVEKIRIENSMDRVLREDIYSKIEMPPFDKSAVDGYAVRSRDASKVSVKLECIGLIQAGENLKKPIKKGECVKIMTGTPMPEGADGVIMMEDAIDSAKSEHPDLIILDLMLPGIDGLEVCNKIKGDSKTASIPIIMPTAKSQESNKVVGSSLGTDDYVTKPFEQEILPGKIKELLKD